MAELIGGPAAVGRRGGTGVRGASVGPPGLDAINRLRDAGRRGRALFGKTGIQVLSVMRDRRSVAVHSTKPSRMGSRGLVLG